MIGLQDSKGTGVTPNIPEPVDPIVPFDRGKRKRIVHLTQSQTQCVGHEGCGRKPTDLEEHRHTHTESDSVCGTPVDLNPDPNTDGFVQKCKDRSARGIAKVGAIRSPNHHGNAHVYAAKPNSMARTLARIRSQHTVEAVRDRQSSTLPSYTCFDLCTGGCLDVISSILAGFKSVGGTEDVKTKLGQLKACLYENLTGSKCYGDNRDIDSWGDQITQPVHYVKSGTPCTDYASLSKNRVGCRGTRGGDLFLQQVDIIDAIRPLVVRIEMVPSALYTNDGKEVKTLMEALSDLYTVHARVVKCWEHGDVTSRQRLMIIGLDRERLKGVQWTWPEPVFDENLAPTARDIAVDDKLVKPNYWRHDGSTIQTNPNIRPAKAGRIQHVGYAGDPNKPKQAGYSDLPLDIHGWDGVWATQMSTNGGSRRPRLDWNPSEPLGDTRMTVPVETCRIASLDEDSYMHFARQHYRKSLGMSYDQWLRELVNLGVPVCTGIAIDQQVAKVLQHAGIPRIDPINPSSCGEGRGMSAFIEADNDNEYHDDGLTYPCECHQQHALVVKHRSCYEAKGMTFSDDNEEKVTSVADYIIAGLGDTGASDHLQDSYNNDFLRNTERSGQRYDTASATPIIGDLIGDMDITVLNLDNQPDCPSYVDHTIRVTTIEGLGVDEGLFSLDAEYRDNGFDVNLTHGYNHEDRTGLYRPKGTGKGPERFIPMQYGYNGQSGWRVPYVVKKPGVTDSQHYALVEAMLAQGKRDNRARKARPHVLHAFVGNELERTLHDDPRVVEQYVSHVADDDDRDIRSTFTYGGLRRNRAKNWHEVHTHWAHLGDPHGPCAICDMFKGAARHRSKNNPGRVRDTARGRTWHLDMIVFKERSEEGSKYLLVITEDTSQFKQLIPLYWKSDAVPELKRWIKQMRSHPAYAGISHQIVGKIITDNESVWSEDASAFQAMIDELGGLEMEYGDPADHARDNATAEGANKIILAGICSLLYERNLPPNWWQRAANDVMFLAARLPLHSETRKSPSGEASSPLEVLFDGYVSRHQIYRELDCYVPVGTPALCHIPGSKSNSLEPRVRWGIAIGQRGKVTRWMDPYTHSRFRSRSFTAHHLKTGLNWSQFLGLGDIAPSAQSRMMPGDDTIEWTIELPHVRPNQLEASIPIREITARLIDEREDLIVKGSAVDGSDLFEFMPKIRKRTSHELGGSGTDNHDSSDERRVVERSKTPYQQAGVQIVDQDQKPLIIGTDGSPDEGPAPNLYIEGDIVPDNDDSANPDPIPTLMTANTKKKGKKHKSDKQKKVTIREPDEQRKGGQGASDNPDQSNIDERVCDDLSIHIDTDYDIELLENAEAKSLRKYAITTDGELTWSKVCKHHHTTFKELPHEHHNLYRLWLLTKPVREGERAIYVEDLPKTVCASRTPLRKGITLPYPSGIHWRSLIHDSVLRKECGEKFEIEDWEEEKHCLAVLAHRLISRHHARDGSTSEHDSRKAWGRAHLALVCEMVSRDDFDTLVDARGLPPEGQKRYAKAARRIMKAHDKIKSTGETPDPTCVVDALMGNDAEGWVESLYREFDGLDAQGVFSHNWSKQDLLDAGITGKPVPCSTALTHKWKETPEGGKILDKLKSRICIAGHKGNVTKGIHYHEVFSPSPIQYTERFLQALRVNLHLENIALDICQAYTWAPLPKGERIAVVYPDGFKRKSHVDGQELFAVLECNLYGMPSAARGWQKHRDEFLLSYFNTGPWTIRTSRMDPCLFIIDKKKGNGPFDGSAPKRSYESVFNAQDNEGGVRLDDDRYDDLPDDRHDIPDDVDRTWMLIHTDDCDLYGSNKEVLLEINDILNDKWETKLVDESYVLGVRREVTRDPQGWSVKLTMKSFIDDLVKAFHHDLDGTFGKRTINTPFPENVILSKFNAPDEGEVDRNIARGYQRLVGSLLWAVRHVSPICSYGCSQLCKLMSAPTDHAWECALHMLKYLDQHRDEGIIFRETDLQPCAMVDASNKDDMQDGRTQYGYVIHWGGPIITKSSKLNHVGINSTYNEYMALHHCIKSIYWLRQLMLECGLGYIISEPTVVLADNKQANKLCAEDMITSGNMYFRTGYHYNKEAVNTGYVDNPVYLHTSLNVSDCLTKSLGPGKIKEFDSQLSGVAPLHPGIVGHLKTY